MKSFILGKWWKIVYITLFSFTIFGCSIEDKVTENNHKSYSHANTKSSPNEIPDRKSSANNAEVQTVIDVLAVYSSDKYSSNIELLRSKIEHSLSVTNEIYRKSHIPARFRLVKISPYSVDKQLKSKGALQVLASDHGIKQLRQKYHADVVVLFRDYAHDGLCGIAFQNNGLSKNRAYAHITLTCPSDTMAHELGHTMGLVHSDHDVRAGRYPYAKGYGVEGEFVTVMAYKTNYHTTKKILHFSSPNVECMERECGVAGASDAASALREVIGTVAAFN